LIAINVSMVEFRDKDFIAGVRAILNDTGLDPRHLEFELTESGLMQDTETTIAVLRALKDLGVRLAIDDFGTGYSCLSYLRRFPINTFKIDRSFLQDFTGVPAVVDLAAMREAVLHLGGDPKTINMNLVGMGILPLEFKPGENTAALGSPAKKSSRSKGSPRFSTRPSGAAIPKPCGPSSPTATRCWPRSPAA